MEDVIEKTTKTVTYAEKDLLTSIALKDPTFQELEAKLGRLRVASQDLIFLDIGYATEKKVETRLWDAHVKVNGKFRKELAVFKEGEGKRRHVERRKLEKLYLDFIKLSTKFYRGYIHRLACHFADVPEIEAIARRFKLDLLTVNERVACDSRTRKLVLTSCHATLVRLGDLSRYRETELQSKNRNWGPAKGYYDLAITIDYTSGLSYNQMAVIALADQDHLQATYYLCRALCVSDPAQNAQGNLDIELRKILKHHREESLPGADTVTARCLVFYARCFHHSAGKTPSAELKNVLDQLRVQIADPSYEEICGKLCLIGIAVEWLSSKREIGHAKYETTTRDLRQFNVRVFTMLCQIALSELQGNTVGQTSHTSETDVLLAQVSPLLRLILPSLRFYSVWLFANVKELIPQKPPFTDALLSKMWKCYAVLLTSLTNSFPITKISEAQETLPEDKETIAFLPFPANVQARRTKGNNYPDPSIPTASNGHAEEPVLYRIKDLVRDGLHLVRGDTTDVVSSFLSFAQGQFIYLGPESTQESPAAQPLSSVSKQTQHTPKTETYAQKAATAINGRGLISTATKPVARSSINGVTSSTNSVADMVNDLVDPEMADVSQNTSALGSESNTAPVSTPISASSINHKSTRPRPSALNAQDLVRQMQPLSNPTTPAHFQQQHPTYPGLPGIWNNAFTPRPGETPGSSPHQSLAPRLTPPYSASGYSSNANVFYEQMEQKQQEIQMRTSPRASIGPSSMTYHTTSSAVRPTFNPYDDFPATTSPWQSSPVSRPNFSEGVEVPRQMPQAALFGAIGEARRGTAKTPTSGQGG